MVLLEKDFFNDVNILHTHNKIHWCAFIHSLAYLKKPIQLFPLPPLPSTVIVSPHYLVLSISTISF